MCLRIPVAAATGPLAEAANLRAAGQSGEALEALLVALPGPLEAPADADWARRIQMDLVDLEYDPGPIDGIFGTMTRRAVFEFSVDHCRDTGPEMVPACSRALAFPGLTPPIRAGLLALRAASLAAADDLEAALDDIELAAGLAPVDGNLLALWGEITFRRGQAAAAAELYRQALRLEGGHAGWQAAHIAALKSAGAADDRVRALSEAITGEPDNADLHLDRAAALLDLGRPEDALFDLGRAARLRPQDADLQFLLANVLRQQGSHAPAIRAYRATLAQDPERLGAWINLGLAAEAVGDRKLARQAVAAALALAPERTDLAERLAAIDLAAGDDAAAIHSLSLLIEGEPEAWDARADRARLLAAAGDPAGAIADLDALVAAGLDPIDRPGGFHRARSRAREALGDLAGAFDDLTAAAAREDGAPVQEARIDLARRLGDETRLLAALAALLALEPGRADARLERALRLRQAGRDADALVEFETAAAHDALDADLTFQWALTLISLQRPAPAAEILQLAAALAPESLQVWMTRAGVALRLGDLETADIAFSRSIELAPDRPAAHVGRAAARWGAGTPEAAMRDLDAALALAPDDRGAIELLQRLLAAAGRYDGPVDGVMNDALRAARQRVVLSSE